MLGSRSRGGASLFAPRPILGMAALGVVFALLGASLGAATASATTATVTTIDVPTGTQYGAFDVTAHVRPAPQPEGGFTPAVWVQVDGMGGHPAPLDANGDAADQLS